MDLLRTLRWVGGAPIVLAISIWTIFAHVQERNHSHEVLAREIESTASAKSAPDVEAITLEWKDTAGRSRTAVAWTGKPFARQVRTGTIGHSVRIKYVEDSSLEPVVLSEAAERERVNAWWITSSIGMSLVMALLCVGLGLAYANGVWPRGPAGLHRH
jgi:hypothetical protein